MARTFVAVAPPSRRVAGYYSLAASAVRFEHLPDPARRRLPRYPVPSVLLARLAVDATAQGQGLGAALLVDAGRRVRTAAEQVGVRVLEVHALDEEAAAFYRRHGALPLLDDPAHLVFDLRLF